jgi:hypothetical protein
LEVARNACCDRGWVKGIVLMRWLNTASQFMHATKGARTAIPGPGVTRRP